MTMVEKVQRTVDTFAPHPDKKEELARLSEFFARMKAAGIAVTRPYDLPPLDTIGRAWYEGGPSQSARIKTSLA